MRKKTKIKVFLSILVIVLAFVYSVYLYGESNGELTQLFVKASKLIPIYLGYISTIVIRDKNVNLFLEEITCDMFAYDKKKRKKLLSIVDSYYDKMYLAAAVDCDELVKDCSTDEELSVIYTIKGMCLLNRKRARDKALSALEKAVECNERNSYAWANLGYVYCQKKDTQKAQEMFEKAVGIDSYNSFAHSNLAISYLYSGRIHLAMSHAEFVLNYDNKRNDAIAVMALCSAFQGDLETSRQYCKKYKGKGSCRRMLRNWIREITARNITGTDVRQLKDWTIEKVGRFRERF